MLIKKRQSGLPLRLIDSKTRSEYRRHKTATILTGYDCPVPTSCTTTVHILTSLVHLFSDMIFYKEYFNRWKYSPINGSIIPHLKEFSQYQYELTKDGEPISAYPDKDNHCIDAVRYAMERVWKRRGQ